MSEQPELTRILTNLTLDPRILATDHHAASAHLAINQRVIDIHLSPSSGYDTVDLEGTYTAAELIQIGVWLQQKRAIAAAEEAAKQAMRATARGIVIVAARAVIDGGMPHEGPVRDLAKAFNNLDNLP